MGFDSIKKILLIALVLFSFNKDLYALGYEGSRDSRYNNDSPSKCNTGDLGSFDILNTTNRDVEWVVGNPTCFGFMAGFGATLVAASITSAMLCVPSGAAGPYSQAPSNGPYPFPVVDPGVGVNMFSAFFTCGRKMSLAASAAAYAATACAANAVNMTGCAIAQGYAIGAAEDQARCCPGVFAYAASITTAVAVLGTLFETAAESFEEARVCGHNWFTWKEFDVNGNPIQNPSSVSQADRGYWRRGPYENSHSLYVTNKYTTPTTMGAARTLDLIKETDYREFLYSGVEFTDESGECGPPSSWNSETQELKLGYADHNQRYYMRGPGVSANFACHRYLSNGTQGQNADELEAFNCCVERSQGAMCIENNTVLGRAGGINSDLSGVDRSHDSEFCALGQDCMSSAVGFTVKTSISQVNTICAETKTLCPYDHLLGGGTEEEVYGIGSSGNVLTGKLTNYCQFNKHCVKVPSRPYIRMNDYDSAFISSACMNFVGHSQNVYSNTNEFLPVSNIKNFSAPLVECMSETLKNMIQNRAGYTQCSNPDEFPRREGSQYICDGGYDFREGDRLTTPSAFESVQNLIRSAVKLALVFSIVLLGYSTLRALKPLDRKTILVYVLKFAFVVYFALGTGWQDIFVNNIFKVSSNLSSMVMKFEDESLVHSSVSNVGTSASRNAQQAKLDGCQFPKFNADLTRNAALYPNAIDDPFYAVSNPGDRGYTDGFQYLKPWDTLDCKFVRALGFGPDMTVPNLVLTILAGLFTGGLGIIFVMFSFMFAFCYVSMIIRALHIFLISVIAVAILIFVSPITITAILFQKTKGIFDKWLKQLLGFIIQPAILFAYLSIFVGVMDHAAYGIRHDLPDNGGITFAGDGLESPKVTVCNGDANNNSLYCIFGFSQFGSYSGFEPIGIIVPFLINLNKEKLNTIIEAGLLMFIFATLMDRISDIAYELTGSRQINSNSPSAAKIAGGAGSMARGVQKRAQRAGMKVAGSASKTRAGKAVGRGLQKGANAVKRGVGNAASGAKGMANNAASKAGRAASSAASSVRSKMSSNKKDDSPGDD